MFKKTKVREIIELLNKDLSAREIAEMLSVSRNTVSYVKKAYDSCYKDWDEISLMNDDEIYEIFYPHTFRPRNRFVPVDYSYVHKELKKIGVTETLLWEEYCDECNRRGLKHCCFATFTTGYKRFLAEKNYTSHVEHKPGVTLEVDWSGPTMEYIDTDTGEIVTVYLFVATFPYSQYTYIEGTTSMNQANWLTCNVHMFEFFGGTPVRIVCDNLKTGVISHPRHGEVVLNEAYLSLAEYYQVVIIPAGVKKPKHKASVEGSVGKIARRVIGMLRNETFHSLSGLNNAIKKTLEILNNKPFEKRESNRKNVFELEELPKLKPLPLVPYEVCSWSYNHLVHPDSHIVFNKGRYSVPSEYLNKHVDVKYNSSYVYIYYSHELIAKHAVIPPWNRNGKRTDIAHLPRTLYKPDTVETIIEKASAVGPATLKVVQRLFENAKVKEQAIIDAKTLLDIGSVYDNDRLETACAQASKDFYMITYNTLIPYIKKLPKSSKEKNSKGNDIAVKKTGIVRGADYYRRTEINE